MGLNETYNAVRSQILLMDPLPTVNNAYSMLMQEESQRKHNSSNIGVDSIPFSSVQMVQKKRFFGTCDHCKIKGHKRENCYRLVGYPADFKFTKRKANTGSDSVVNNVTATVPAHGNEVVDSLGSSPQMPMFTQEQYHQIMNLLSKEPAVEAAASLAESPVECALGSSCVRLPNGSSVSITHVGTCNILPNLQLAKVLYVPNFHYNLLSVSKLTNDLNCVVSFYPQFCLIQNLFSGKMRGIGRARGGLYILDPS
ncbi:hypothetical protein V6Z12_D12G109100 [Gossypium hirsutum]